MCYLVIANTGLISFLTEPAVKKLGLHIQASHQGMWPKKNTQFMHMLGLVTMARQV
jgi:hypothetical protein